MTNVKKPALFLRNLERIEVPEDSDLEKTVLGAYSAGIERIQWVRASRDMEPNMAVVYFHSEEAAFACLGKLHSSIVDGDKIAVSYRLVVFYFSARYLYLHRIIY